MRLDTFISENMEVILKEWVNFARDVWPTESPCITELRDHAQEMLLATVADMRAGQSEAEQHEKSLGKGAVSDESDSVDQVSVKHAESRYESGFDLRTLVAEYRALRASVLHLWSQAAPNMTATQVDDITRFNECVDQLLAESVMSYTASVEHSRELFLGILGHDLRTPLCAMSTAAHLLKGDMELSSSARRLASLLVVSTKEMGDLVVDLLDFAATRLGSKMPITRQRMDLEELCSEVIEEVKLEHPTTGFDLETCGDGQGEWDRRRLRQLMTNLLVNAVQHGAEESPIRLSLEANEDEVAFAVCNQGPAIPPNLRAVIFDPLSRGTDDELERRTGSLGLGLYIAREIANAHGGMIDVSSTEGNTAFTVRLPRSGGLGARLNDGAIKTPLGACSTTALD